MNSFASSLDFVSAAVAVAIALVAKTMAATHLNLCIFIVNLHQLERPNRKCRTDTTIMTLNGSYKWNGRYSRLFRLPRFESGKPRSRSVCRPYVTLIYGLTAATHKTGRSNATMNLPSDATHAAVNIVCIPCRTTFFLS